MLQTTEHKPHVFLDTSLQISRLLGPSEQRQSIEHILEQTIQAHTTPYVYMEYQRTVGSDFAHVHQTLLNQEEWGDAVATVATGQRAFRPRSLVRINRILGETLNRSHLDREKGLLFLATYLEYRLHALFWRNVTSLEDLITCDLISEGINRQSDTSYSVADSCRKETAACQLPSFLAGQRPKLQTIADHLTAHPKIIKDQDRVERLLTTIIADPRAALGQSACWPLGDIVIALQVPTDYALWTLDSDFEMLAEILEIQLYKNSL